MTSRCIECVQQQYEVQCARGVIALAAAVAVAIAVPVSSVYTSVQLFVLATRGSHYTMHQYINHCYVYQCHECLVCCCCITHAFG
jgi:hypothetical protein